MTQIDLVSSHSALAQDRLIREYRHRTPRSALAFERGARVLPGCETRSVTTYAPYPTIIDEGQGAWLKDLDGNWYIDLVNNYTSLIHGNAYAPAMEAATSRLTRGAVFASPHESQFTLAQSLVSRIPSVERVRFTNSGTEAGLLAARLATAATGRQKILIFEGSYHGSAPCLKAGHPDVTVVPYNDIDAVEQAVTAEVAAVVVEPFLGAGGVVPAAPGFLQRVQDLARSRGALFILDEVQSLRNSVGGEQLRLGLNPDLTLLGKIIGGGLPIGAVGGSESLLRLTTSTTPGHLSHSGTFNGHLAATAAGAVTLEHLDAGAIEQLDHSAQALQVSITESGSDAGLPLSVTRAGSILNVHFTYVAPTTASEVNAADLALLPILHLALLQEGVYTTPRGLINLSTALGASALATVKRAYSAAFARVGEIVCASPHAGRDRASLALVPSQPSAQR